MRNMSLPIRSNIRLLNDDGEAVSSFTLLSTKVSGLLILLVAGSLIELTTSSVSSLA